MVSNLKGYRHNLSLNNMCNIENSEMMKTVRLMET